MNIQIVENNEGYMLYINSKKSNFYKWGNGLTELINHNFDNIINFLNSSSVYNVNNTDYYEKLIKLDDFIYYEAITNNIKLFLDNNKASLIDSYAFVQSLSTMLYELIQFKEILLKFFFKLCCYNKNEVDEEFWNDTYSLINQKFPIKPTIFDSQIITSSLFFTRKKSVQLIHNFSNVIELCKYELYMFLNTKNKIVKCQNCGNFFIIEKKNMKYCSNKCKNTYQENNDFYRSYRNKYKNLSHKYNEDTNEYNYETEKLRDKVRELYHEYKIYYRTPEQDLKYKEFIEKISQIK